MPPSVFWSQTVSVTGPADEMSLDGSLVGDEAAVSPEGPGAQADIDNTTPAAATAAPSRNSRFFVMTSVLLGLRGRGGYCVVLPTAGPRPSRGRNGGRRAGAQCRRDGARCVLRRRCAPSRWRTR